MRALATAWCGPILLTTLVASATLDAQVSASADLGGVVHRTGADLWRSTSRVEPVLRIDRPWAQGSADADLWSAGSEWRLQRTAVDLLGAPPPFGPFRFTALAHVERVTTSPFLEPTARTTGSFESAVSLRFGQGGGWLGLAAERAPGIDSLSARPLLRAGFWHRFGMATIAFSAQSHRARLGGRAATLHYGMTSPDSSRDTLTGVWTHNLPKPFVTGDSGAPSRLQQWSDMQARIAWSAGRVSVDGRVGVQPKVDMAPRSLWARGTATIAFSPRLALVAGGGTQPASLWLGAPSSRFVSVGLRVAPAALVHSAPPSFVRPSAASFVIRPADGDSTTHSYVITVRVPDARAVDISGDFNGWHAVALREARPGMWETTLSLLPGTHRVSLRVNGDRWDAPPGLPTADDDFNGRVGLLLVR